MYTAFQLSFTFEIVFSFRGSVKMSISAISNIFPISFSNTVWVFFSFFQYLDWLIDWLFLYASFSQGMGQIYDLHFLNDWGPNYPFWKFLLPHLSTSISNSCLLQNNRETILFTSKVAYIYILLYSKSTILRGGHMTSWGPGHFWRGPDC